MSLESSIRPLWLTILMRPLWLTICLHM
jgi:hypothetical protein